MCGIWAIFGCENCSHKICDTTFTKIDHRGPDAWRIEFDQKLKNCCFGFHRLTIVDHLYGMQPMRLHKYPNIILLCNGEIYNFSRLQKQFNFEYETKCDVEAIIHLYVNFGIEETCKNLDGVFGFCLIDIDKGKIFLGRDPYGVRPLFKMTTPGGVLGICSEAKGLANFKDIIKNETIDLVPFKPGTFDEFNIVEQSKTKLLRSKIFHSPGDRPTFVPFLPYEDLQKDHFENIRELLTMSVRKRLMADRRIGCLLSGGLDSSLIAALLVQEAKKINIPYKIQTFSIGMGDSPDVRAARKVAAHIGSEHHEVTFTEEDVAKVLDEVIYHLETPDITTIRASIPMFLISKYIKNNTDTTVLLSGEGADELAQGYIYFRDAPDAQSGHEESLRLLREIYLFDGLRADRTVSGQQLELRCPFLDLQFTNYYLSIPSTLRQPNKGVEKYLLRKAFDETNLLPHDILWRHKEAFSDGVASQQKSLFVVLQEIVDKRYMEKYDRILAAQKFPHCTPTSKESLYYREIFEKSFNNLAKNFIPYFWMPRWVEGITDPSARFIKHYDAK